MVFHSLQDDLEPVSVFLLAVAAAFLCAMVVGAICMCIQVGNARPRCHIELREVM